MILKYTFAGNKNNSIKKITAMTKTISCQECENNRCLVKNYCDEKWLEKVDEVKEQLFETEGQHIFSEGQRVRGVYIIQQGKVKIISDEMRGKLRVVRIAGNGHFIGHHALNYETYPVNAVTIENSTICFIDNENLYQIFMKNPKLTYEVMKFYVVELQKLESRLKNSTLLDCREKVAEALLVIKDVFGVSSIDKSLNGNLTRMDIAEMAGENVENVIRNLSKFESEGFITKKGKKLILKDEEGLKKLIMN